ncbi:MAG: M48 family metallopeptidase [Rhodoferax sp.]|nr:M48 family metallopeptidase [Rhodoferax sp.]
MPTRLLQYTLDLFQQAPAADAVAPKASGSESLVYQHPQADRQLRLGAVLVGYQFSRGKRRTIGFTVRPEGLAVRAPRSVSLAAVDAALREKADWILQKLAEAQTRQARQAAAAMVWRDGAELPYLGGVLRLHLFPESARSRIDVHLQVALDPIGTWQLHLRVPIAATEEQMESAARAWLMRQARAHFQQRLDYFAPLLQVRWTRLGLSNARTRWGSARTDGSIRLNWRLLHCSEALVDYVVVHELSHLRYMDHSPRFWDTLRSVVPDYAGLRKQLKDTTVPVW